MKLEHVLARWARDNRAAKAPKDAAEAVAGRWTNEYGSVADLKVDGVRITGTFTSAVGGDGAPLTGPVTGWVSGDVVAFAVHWPGHTRSLTSWVDQIVDDGGAPVLQTLWHLVVDIPDAEEAAGLWATVHTGADTFR